jgi:hypothetical protein
MAKGSDEKLSPKETQQRFDATLKRMLTTPHKPHKPLRNRKRSKKAKPSR